jgi:hypothetical protein
MRLNNKLIDDLPTRWRVAFAEELTRGEADAIALLLLGLYRDLMRSARDLGDVGEEKNTPTPPS